MYIKNSNEASGGGVCDVFINIKKVITVDLENIFLGSYFWLHYGHFCVFELVLQTVQVPSEVSAWHF